MATDEELIEQIRHGENEAYGDLFRRYYAQIYGISLSMLKDPQEAEEVAQEDRAESKQGSQTTDQN